MKRTLIAIAFAVTVTPSWAQEDGQPLIDNTVPFMTSSPPSSLPDVIAEPVQLADSVCGKLPSALGVPWEEMDRVRSCRTDVVMKYLERRPKQ